MTAALQGVAAPSPVSAVDLLDIASPTVNPAPRATREGSRTVIWLDGDNDLATLSTLAATLSRVTDDVADDVIVDLSGVTFISATTLGELIRCRNDLRDRSRNLTLRSRQDAPDASWRCASSPSSSNESQPSRDRPGVAGSSGPAPTIEVNCR